MSVGTVSESHRLFLSPFLKNMRNFTDVIPESLTLTKVLYKLPDSWQEQRKLVGIA